ncbi:MAG: FtsW/RodA/SpoVE family cell cycle protein [candidate division WOR-3 bacterium]
MFKFGRYYSDPRLRRTSPIDSRILFVVVALVMAGVIAVYATTLDRGASFLRLHAVRVLLGATAMTAAALLNHTVFSRRLRWILLIVAAGLLVLTRLVGLACGVARRDLEVLFVSFQPAEFAKYALILWLAGYFADLVVEGKEPNFRNTVAKPGLIVLGMVLLTLVQPSIGTSVIMVGSCLVLFFLAGVRVRFLLPVTLVMIVLVAGVIRFQPYANRRWKNFVNGNRYHQQQSLIAIGSGGLFGMGLGEGRQKRLFLPKMHNDFIFASVGEEAGFVGSVAVFLFYALLLIRGMRVSQEASEIFSQLLAAGITVMLFMYALVHVAVTLGLVPTTGQPLPFISYGGSALIANMAAAGVLLNISLFRRIRTYPADPFRGWRATNRFGGTR